MSEKDLEALIKASGSLAQFLADKEKCKAVWGKEIQCCLCHRKHGMRDENCNAGYLLRDKEMKYENMSVKAFHILQQEGEEACIKFIKDTII